MTVRAAIVGLALTLALVGAPAALAAPPGNDARVNAARLSPPDSASGTVVDATLEGGELASGCGATDASVWYRFRPPAGRDVVVQFDAGGDLDATVDVYERNRSQLTSLDCAVNDRKGSATLDFRKLDAEREYLVRVGKLDNSDPAGFKLQVLVASPPAAPPGRLLSKRGARDSVDRIVNPSDAYSVRLRSGETYRLNLAAQGCTSLSVYAPGIGSFDAGVEKRLSCGGYRLFTPERSGRFSLLVEAGRRRGTQPYRLRVARARADDTAPGVFIRNDVRVRGRVNGLLDSVDLYRFDVLRRSTLNLSVSGGPELTLLSERGKRIASRTSSVRRVLGAGRYFVAVRGSGRYRLRRISKTITHSALRFDGRQSATTSPGRTSALTLLVRPGVSGRGRITLERFDPLSGWQFLRTYRVRASGGRASVSFTPPSVGRYRARASFLGSRSASPSDTRVARLRVVGPLQE